MKQQIVANMLANLKFYRRNKFLFLFGIFLLFIFGLMFVPSLLITQTRKFDVIQLLVSQLSGFTSVFVAALGLMSLSHHQSQRCLKMVITKPCPLEIWVLSNFASATAVSLCAHLLIFLLALGLFAIWSIPFQWGIIFVLTKNFLQTVILISYITFLAAIWHPAMVVLFVWLFQDTTFYGLLSWVLAGIKSVEQATVKTFLQGLQGVLYGIYLILPQLNPFAEETKNIARTYYLQTSDWSYLGGTLSYTLLISTFFYLLAVYFLRRKQHI